MSNVTDTTRLKIEGCSLRRVPHSLNQSWDNAANDERPRRQAAHDGTASWL